jgi:hypothetical protein
MRHARHLHFYEYLDRPYDLIRMAFAEGIFESLGHATKAAADRVLELSTSLHGQIAWVEVDKPIAVKVRSFEQSPPDADLQTCSLRIAWEAATHPGLFPRMEAEIEAHPVSKDETQLALFGDYRPPLGALGRGADALIGHRLAEASVHRFLRELVDRLRIRIPPLTTK